MRLRSLALLLFMLLAFCGLDAPARADDAPSATAEALHHTRETFAHDFANTVLAILQDPKKSYGDRKDILRQAFAKSVDMDWIAHFVLGKAWRTADEQQRERYTTLYRRYLTETYVSNFAENPDKRISDITILGVVDRDDTDFTVRTRMRLADNAVLNVSYLVRETDGKYKVLDIAIENVSLIATHRAEFTALADAHGIDGVISRLEELARGETADRLFAAQP